MADYIVDILADENDGNFEVGDRSLREAIALANANPGEDTIRIVAEGVINLTVSSLFDSALILEDIAKTTIIGPGADKLAISGGGQSSVFLVYPKFGGNFATAQLQGLTIADGRTPGEIPSGTPNALPISLSTIGGGISNYGNLTIVDSVITNNETLGRGAGGIMNRGALTVINSTISNNKAAVSGGGIATLNSYFVGQSLSTTLINTAISGNTGVERGGGLFVFDSVTNSSLTTIVNSTITNNITTISGGSGILSVPDADDPIVVHNSIIAGNILAIPNTPSTADDIRGMGDRFQSNGSNLIGVVTTINPPNPSDPPLLGILSSDRFTGNINDVIAPLALNGGFIPTHALITSTTNPAINGGTNETAPQDLADRDGDGNTIEIIPFDQRGINFNRLEGTIDIGAFELQLPSVNLAIADATASESNGDTGRITLTRAASINDPLFVTIGLSGTASAADYSFSAGVGGAVSSVNGNTVTAVFLQGVTSFDLTLNAIADTIIDPNETVTLTLQGGNDYSPGTDVSGTITIAELPPIQPPTQPPSTGSTGVALGAIAFTPRGAILKGTRRSDQLLGTRKADRLTGGNGNDNLDGGNGNDLLNGDRGNDTLIGRNGRDQLNGGLGNDRLIGGNGNDILVGGAGNDTLTLGQGTDMAVFNSVGDRTDMITDFVVGQDLIDLRGIFRQAAFQTTGSAFDRFTQFVQLTGVGSNTEVLIDADGVGANTTLTRLAVLQGVSVSNINSLSFVVGRVILLENLIVDHPSFTGSLVGLAVNRFYSLL
ncbi:MAG: calcium-binding protein [Leptolyngbyaceae cyanobacterium SL_7_1]|nr:calcium-binding protein [Leptolyngbyaceae cyanobacterium SL_7_1]